MNRFLHIIFCAIWLSLLSNHSIAQSEEGDLDCLEFEPIEDITVGPIAKFLAEFPSHREEGKFYSAEVDLNADGVNEYFFLADAIYFCGQSRICKIYGRMSDENGSYRDIIERRLPISLLNKPSDLSDPIYSNLLCVSSELSNGWKNLTVNNEILTLTYNGDVYERL